jgi:lysyl-tRNA synthetase class 2
MDEVTREGRALGRGRIVPALAGTTALAIGAVNVLGGLAGSLHGGGALRHARRVPDEILFAHRFELPLGLALLVAAVYLLRRRRGALWTTVALLVAIGILDLLKGFQVDELVAWGAAAALVRWRAAFRVRLETVALPRTAAVATLTAAAAVACGWLLLLLAARWSAAPYGGPRAQLRADLGLLSLVGAPERYRGPGACVPYVLGAIGALAFLRIAWLVCRRPRPPACRLPVADVVRILRAHGSDTLAAFKLRADLDHMTSPDGRALLSYRVVGGVLLVAGDPVGPPEETAPLLAAARRRAHGLGLRLGVLGASDDVAAAARAIGLRTLYVGDEAIVDARAFSLEGHAIKKVRQAVRRVQRNGYAVEVRTHAELAEAELAELDALCARARGAARERGFAMALDSLRGEHLADSWLVVARDGRGAARGLLHFTPTHGRAAASLGFMRRDADTPNGLMDFLIVAAIQRLAQQGVEEVSLNFAAFSRFLRAPRSRAERLAGRAVCWGDRLLQLESLYRFNRKFGPRWVPRHLVYEGAGALGRTALAAMAAEGQLGALIGR